MHVVGCGAVGEVLFFFQAIGGWAGGVRLARAVLGTRFLPTHGRLRRVRFSDKYLVSFGSRGKQPVLVRFLADTSTIWDDGRKRKAKDYYILLLGRDNNDFVVFYCGFLSI
jgi:hypothetical protein